MGAKLLLALCAVASLLPSCSVPHNHVIKIQVFGQGLILMDIAVQKVTFCDLLTSKHGATTARLPQRQHPKVTAPMNPDDDDNQFYAAYENHECKKCPPGTFVLRPCTVPRTEGTCQPCENNTYSKLSNSFDYCFGCRACRSLDEVEIKKCTATTNTKCACMNGTFCSPDQPCETCTKCMTSCGPGEKKVQDCTPTSDIQCVPDATSSPPTTCTGFWSCKRTQFLQYLQKRSSPETSEEHDNMLNRQRNQRSEILSPRGSAANGQGRMTPLTVSPPAEEGRGHAEMRKLVPGNGRNPAETLSQSFDAFINKVPPKDWKRFMRLLKLTDNEIDSAEKSSQYGNEQHYQMLRTWLDKNGQAATLSVLLDELSGMGLKGIVEEVTSVLIAQRLYVYEE
uniref:Uncharacterized protein n=1 Tax=Naja naja TaxID=35670 RepID=A0A8C6XG51_NAJNA